MTDRNVSVNLGCLIAGALWMTSVLLLTVAWRLDTHQLGMAGLAVCGVAVTATVRCYIVKHNQLVREAFELSTERARVQTLR